jgi:GR25 family glycosyltransferase involved in LPS biosynthesis
MKIDEIVYINLARRPDRNKHMLKLLKDNNLMDVTTRIDGVDGKLLKRDNIPPTIVTKKGIKDAFNDNERTFEPLTIGAIGCALSHKKCFEYIVDNNISACLILEDDITVVDNFGDIIRSFDLPNNYDIYFLGYHSAGKSSNIDDNWYKPRDAYGLFGYVVTYDGAVKLLDKVFPISQQIDSEIPIYFNTIKACALNNNKRLIFSEPSQVSYSFGTDIQQRNGVSGVQIEMRWYLRMIMVFIILCLTYHCYKKYCLKN